MKKLLIFIAAAWVFQNWDTIQRYINPPPDYAQAFDGKVILYSTSWCGYCKSARGFLEENGIDFVELDVEKSKEGREQHQRLGGGGIPVLLINGEVVRGYDPQKIMKLIKDSRAPVY